MRFATRARVIGAFAGPAIAALILTGAGPANAAVTTATAHTTSSTQDAYVPFCSLYNLERWDFRGDNTVQLTWNTTSYVYTVHFDQRGSCLSGQLTDPNIPIGPTSGPIHGYVFRNRVTFSFTYTYPTAPQGTRTYTGTISRSGRVSGTWSDSGDGASGTWYLGHAVRPACPFFYPWYGFFQTGNGCPVPFPYPFYY